MPSMTQDLTNPPTPFAARVIRIVTIVSMAVGSLAACVSQVSEPGTPIIAANIIAVTGNDAQMKAGGATDTLGVYVSTADGDPIHGAVVTWSVMSGNATVHSIATVTDSTGNAITSNTDVNGIARIVVTSGPDAGTAVVQASTGQIAPIQIDLNMVLDGGGSAQ